MQPDLESNAPLVDVTDLKSDAAVVARQPAIDKMAGVAKTLAIKTESDYLQAVDYLRAIKGLLNDTESDRERMVAPHLKRQREINADAKAISAPLQEAEAAIKLAMDGYMQKQEELRLEEQAKADEVARKEQERLQKQADKAAASGKVERAEQLGQRAAMVVAPVIERAAPKVAGIVKKELWKFEVTDSAAVPREYLSVDEKKIGGVVRSLKGDTKIPGVRVWKTTQIAAGAA